MAKQLSKTQMLGRGLVCAAGFLGCQVLAQEEDESRGVEEVLVTAQRSEESIQDVPISVTALTGEMLEARQIVNPSDLQLNAPNVSFTATNFGGSSFSIRGIGRLVIAASGDAGVSTHINEIPIASNLTAVEFFDVERVELLRGPQGTLFGRNATGGAINMVTRMPDTEAISGMIDLEYGDYNHTRVKGAVNIPITDSIAIRAAGMFLKRDGYIKNLAFGQQNANYDASAPTTPGKEQFLPGIDGDIDGRNFWTGRITALWEVTDDLEIWVQYNRFDENDDKVRISNQVCSTTPLPTTGCDPNMSGFQQPHLGTTTAGIFAATIGALPFGSPGGNDDATVSYDYPRPAGIGFRSIHTDVEPIFENMENNILVGIDWDISDYSFGLLFASQNSLYFSRQDYNMNVGATLNPIPGVNFPAVPAVPATGTTPAVPAVPAVGTGGLYPTANVPRGPNANLTVTPCNVLTGQSGSVGGTACTHPSNQTRVFSYDQADNDTEYKTVELRASSKYDGPLNFTLGINGYKTESHSDYYVVANTLDLLTNLGVGGNRLYPGYFSSQTNNLNQDGWAIFGEVYYDVTEDIKVTAGFRYNEDNKKVQDSGVLANSFYIPVPVDPANNPTGAVAAAGSNPGGGRWVRTSLAAAAGQAATAGGTIAAGAPVTTAAVSALTAGQAALIGFHSSALLAADTAAVAVVAALPSTATPQEVAAAVGALAQARLAAISAVPIVPAPGETRFLTGSPSDFSWKEASGRVGVDWKMTEDTLVYAFYSRGYKPGGFNPSINPSFQDTSSFSFQPESVDSFEIGSKNTLLDGTLTLNAAAFFYSYTGLQVTRIANNSSLNDNIDAKISGVELESVWKPDFAPGLSIDASYSYLNSKVDGSTSVDPLNRTAGNPDWVVLQNIDPGSLTAVTYIAERAGITAPILAAALAVSPNGAALPIPGTLYPEVDGVAIPLYFSRAFLNGAGVKVSDGLQTNLDGKTLPNSPDHTVHLGVAYTYNIGAIKGDLTLRWDWYWQSKSYAREFNTLGDEIASWQQHNLSLIYDTNDKRLQARLWIRNLANSDNVTGKYLTSDTSGFYRNYFLTEPRIIGASVRYSFGT